jgi:hypothetical protein
MSAVAIRRFVASRASSWWSEPCAPAWGQHHQGPDADTREAAQGSLGGRSRLTSRRNLYLRIPCEQNLMRGEWIKGNAYERK